MELAHSRGDGVPIFERIEIAEALQAIPPEPRERLLRLRALIFSVARATPGVGELEEALKWGEPSYLTKSGSGTTIRIHWKPRKPEVCALYVHCRTDLVARFRERHPGAFEFEGQRALFFPVKGRFPTGALRSAGVGVPAGKEERSGVLAMTS